MGFHFLWHCPLLPWAAKPTGLFHSSNVRSAAFLPNAGQGRKASQATVKQKPTTFHEGNCHLSISLILGSCEVLVQTMGKWKQKPIFEHKQDTLQTQRKSTFLSKSRWPSVGRVSHRARATDTGMCSSQHYQMATLDLCSPFFQPPAPATRTALHWSLPLVKVASGPKISLRS